MRVCLRETKIKKNVNKVWFCEGLRERGNNKIFERV